VFAFRSGGGRGRLSLAIHLRFQFVHFLAHRGVVRLGVEDLLVDLHRLGEQSLARVNLRDRRGDEFVARFGRFRFGCRGGLRLIRGFRFSLGPDFALDLRRISSSAFALASASARARASDSDLAFASASIRARDSSSSLRRSSSSVFVRASWSALALASASARALSSASALTFASASMRPRISSSAFWRASASIFA